MPYNHNYAIIAYKKMNYDIMKFPDLYIIQPSLPTK